MATTNAERYRKIAREFYEGAASAASDELRNQFARLAFEYELLADDIENMGDPDEPLPA